jgi:diacylglycerol kinase family enzyme
VPAPKRPRVVALLNASAGTHQDSKTLADQVDAAFEKHGITAKMEFVTGADLRSRAEQALREMSEGQIDLMVVGGGDGTIRTVAGVLAGSGIALGIIPLGTMNHFAKDLGIPLALEDAVTTIMAGRPRDVDIGEVNGETFINNSSIGIYPYVVLDRERRRSREGRAKWSAMILAGLRLLWHFPLRRLSISAEGLVEPYRSPCLFVGNNEYRLTLPSLGKRERLDGGELCLYVAKRQSRMALFWLACRSVVGRLDQSRDLRILNVRSAEISSRRRRLLVAFDGEIDVMRPPLRYRTRPRALRVLVPADMPAAPSL